MVLLGNIGAERCRQSFSACCWWGIQGRYIDSSRQDKTSNEQTMGEFDMCEMYNFSFIGKDGDKIEPFAVFCLLQNALVIIVNGFTLIVVGRTSASYDHVTQLFFKALSSTYVCLGASFVAYVACSEMGGMHLVAFKLSIAISTSFLFLSLGFLACINVNRYITWLFGRWGTIRLLPSEELGQWLQSSPYSPSRCWLSSRSPTLPTMTSQ